MLEVSQGLDSLLTHKGDQRNAILLLESTRILKSWFEFT